MIDYMIFVSPFLDVKDVYANSFLPRIGRLWNSLAIECFPLNYDLSGFKFIISRPLLTVDS